MLIAAPLDAAGADAAGIAADDGRGDAGKEGGEGYGWTAGAGAFA